MSDCLDILVFIHSLVFEFYGEYGNFFMERITSCVYVYMHPCVQSVCEQKKEGGRRRERQREVAMYILYLSKLF